MHIYIYNKYISCERKRERHIERERERERERDRDRESHGRVVRVRSTRKQYTVRKAKQTEKLERTKGRKGGLKEGIK